MTKPISGAIFETRIGGHYYTRKRAANAVSIIVVKTRRRRTTVVFLWIPIVQKCDCINRQLIAS